MDTATSVIDVVEIRTRVGAALNRLSAEVMAQATVNTSTDTELQSRVAALGQIAAGLAIIDADALPQDGAGFGSTVTAEDVQTGETEEYTLMVGTLVDIDANQVSLASPIGQALLGRSIGDEVTFSTPHRQVTLRIKGLFTLIDLLERHDISIASN